MRANQTAALVWFRRDLRLTDNPALAAAVDHGGPVICVFVLDEGEGGRPLGGASRWWLDKSLRALAKDIEALGGRLILRRGEASVQILTLARETGAGLVTWNRLYDPPLVERDTALKQALKDDGVEVCSFNASLLSEPWTVRTGAGQPFKVFTPYWRAARDRIEVADPVSPPRALKSPAHWPASEPLSHWGLHPQKPDWSHGFKVWTPGEAGAHDRLEHFLDHGLAGYADHRDLPGEDATSRLSPHLHWGEIGPRQVWRRVQAHAKGRSGAGVEVFLSELGWREFNHQLLFHNQDLARVNVRRAFDAFPWRTDRRSLRAWRRGRTGYPLVDAGLRELWATGFMHNRVRMVVASFLIKHLLLDWREGERWFWDTLVDADLANNAANWQWTAGSGADAAPFFRIFNPIAQGEKFDPKGVYVRRWVPELAGLPDKVLHAPWTADAAVLKQAGVELGRTYPKPIVDHARARQRALDALQALRTAD